MEVRVGMLAPGGDAESIRAALAAMEASGLDHAVVGDHVSFIAGFGDDGLVRATTVLALSTYLRVSVGVYLLPLRHPVPVARQLASISQLAPGRLTLGVGVGGEDRREVEMCGVDPRTRGRRMDECMQVLIGLRAGKAFTFHGRFFDLDEAVVLPPPSPPVPLLVGGRSDAAVRRAGRYGDGWLGIWVSPKRFADVAAQCGAEAHATGRGEVDFAHAMQLWCGIASSRDDARALLARRMEGFYRIPFDRFEKYSPYGTAQDIAEFLVPYVEAGCSEFNLLTVCGDDDLAVRTAGEVKRLLSSPR